MVNPNSVLIIKLRHHGDVLLTTPVARILKAHFPECSIDMLVYEGTEALLEGNPDIDKIWSLNRKTKRWRKYYQQGCLLKELSLRKYDWVIHLSDQMQGAFFSKFLAHKEAVGIDYPKRRNFLWRSCFTRLAPLFTSNTRHTVEQNVQSLISLGMDFSNEEVVGRLVINEHDRQVVKNLLDPFFDRIREEKNTNDEPLPYLVVHPASRWFFKCWEDDRFAEVIQYFADQGWPVIITSSPEEEEMKLVDSILQKTKNLYSCSTEAANNFVAPVLEASSSFCTLNFCAPSTPCSSSASATMNRGSKTGSNSSRIISLAGQLTLQQLAALIEGARLFVGVDSVPMHMAAMLQKDTVALFGPSKVNEWHPWRTCYHLINARDYGSLIDPDAVDTSTSHRYLSNIPVAPVITSI